MSLVTDAIEKVATGTHGGAGKSQDFLKHRVRALKREGYPEDSAYAIATKMGQRQGFYRKGTRTLTAKGRAAEKKHERD